MTFGKASPVRLSLENIHKSFGPSQVVKGVSLELHKGEIGCLLGPSGCGKTTLLRIIAGFEPISKGRVIIAGREVTNPGGLAPPEERKVGMVFQDYALFPHLTVEKNVSFGLGRRLSQTQSDKVKQLLEMVGLGSAANRYPHELSGGQQQRVALARALAPEPDLLLLDEPFSNLDLNLRDKISMEVRDIIKALDATALLVTHNQYEAFAVADMVGVLFGGVMQQMDRPYNIYYSPATLEVARFVGDGALISGTVTASGQVQCAFGQLPGKISSPCRVGGGVELLVWPEEIGIVEHGAVAAKVVQKHFRGASVLYTLELQNGEQCLALVSSHHKYGLGEAVGIDPRLGNPVVFPKPAGAA